MDINFNPVCMPMPSAASNNQIQVVLSIYSMSEVDTKGKTLNLNGFTTKNKCYELTFIINNTNVKAMIDSGATVNCISTEMIDKLLLANPSKKSNDIEISDLGDTYTLNSSIADEGSDVKYYATININYKIEGAVWHEKIDAVMFGKLDRYDMIIGIPFLKKYGNFIDWSTGEFSPKVSQAQV